MTKQQLSPSDQCRLAYVVPSAVSTQAGRSYWARVWAYLRADYASVLAIVVLVLLLLASFLGSSLWLTDPNLQHSAKRFAASQGGQTVAIVDDGVWTGSAAALKQFELIAANTQYVRLQWPEKHVNQVAVYRKFSSQTEGLGRLLARPSVAYFEDRFEIDSSSYRYTLVNAQQQIVGQLEVQPEPAINRFYARLSGLITSDSTAQTVTLPAHPLGTDGLGRDTLARLISGGQITLGIGILAPLFATLFGLFYGAFSGFVGGRTDEILMRFADFVIALPFLLFVILLNVALGYGPQSSGVLAMFIALTVMTWPNAAKLVRGQVLVLRETSYIDAARLLGGSRWYIIRVHIMPSVLGAVLVALSFAIPSAIFTEALLSFIGLGVQAPAASWGSMCQEAINELQRHPMQLLYPAALISITVLAFNLLGDSLRDALAVAGGQHD